MEAIVGDGGMGERSSSLCPTSFCRRLSRRVAEKRRKEAKETDGKPGINVYP
jgi:hypothetical protein